MEIFYSLVKKKIGENYFPLKVLNNL